MTNRFDEAVAHVRLTKSVSVKALQDYGIPYTEAATYIERMERAGIITAPNARGVRTVIKPKPTFTPEQMLGSG